MAERVLVDPHRVRRGDTLSGLSRASGRSVAELVRLNQLSNPHRLDVGRLLYLSPQTAFAVSVRFLDALRHPIENLRYRIHFDARTVSGRTASNGQAPDLLTHDASSRVQVWVQDLHGQWVQLCEVASELGHKVITLVSHSLVFTGQSEPHPPSAPTQADAQSLATHTAGPQQPSRNNPMLRTRSVKGRQGQSVIQLDVALPMGLIQRFEAYRGTPISDAQWRDTAHGLGCEEAVLRAIAQVESRGEAFWRLQNQTGQAIPCILFERHWFSRLTRHAFDHSHPDVSGLAYTSAKGAAPADRYGDHRSSYLRLLNAHALNENAALASCSWGKFQIMGGNWRACDAASLSDFVGRMCEGESTQIGLLAGFLRNQAKGNLLKAAQHKDWAELARLYNGPDYRKNRYDSKLEAAYQQHRAALG